jgi:hypothetical protein
MLNTVELKLTQTCSGLLTACSALLKVPEMAPLGFHAVVQMLLSLRDCHKRSHFGTRTAAVDSYLATNFGVS